MAAARKPFVSPEEYLERERSAPTKSEYWGGEIVAMSGVSRYHDRIATTLVAWLLPRILPRGCEPFSADVRVRPTESRYFYPDLSVVCGEGEWADDNVDTLLNPLVVFEILSPTTEASDRGMKALYYRRCEALQALVFVSQDRPLVEVWTRTGDVWTLTEASGLDASVYLPPLELTLPLAELYARVSPEPI